MGATSNYNMQYSGLTYIFIKLNIPEHDLL